MAPINLPDGSEVSEVVLPDGSTASEVIAPDGSTVFSAIPDSVATRPADDTSASVTDGRGLIINPNSDLTAVNAVISENTSGLTTARLLDANANTIATKDISGLSSGDSFKFEQSLTSGTKYKLIADAGGSSYTVGIYGTRGFPYTSEYIDITDAVKSGGTQENNNPQTLNDVGAFL